MDGLRLIPLTTDNWQPFEQLMQFYLYDFSEYFCDDPQEQLGEDGRYHLEYDLRRYLPPPDGTARYWGYLARYWNHWAGFVLISQRADMAPIDGMQGRNIDEFFVMRCFRRQGIGRAMALQTFAQWSGFWQVMQVAENQSAVAFWRSVIDQVSGGQYEERHRRKYEQNQVWQLFDTSD